jgi:hypothetical protein
MVHGRNSFMTTVTSLMILVVITFLSPPSKAFALELKGFSDITFTYARNKSDTTDPNTNGTFALGELDFFISQNLGDRVDFLTEFNFSADPNTNVGSVDIERLQIGYIFNDALKVRAGRFHNILGYWNMTYHHGRQLQTTIERPSFLHFEDDGGLVPTHLVGLWVGGRFDTDIGGLEYGVMAGNGPRVQDVDCPTPLTCTGALSPNSTGDNSKNKAVSFQLRWMPGAIPGLGVGISGNIQQLQFFDLAGNQISIVTPDGSTSREVAQGIYGVDLEYLANNVEFLSEFYQFRDHGTRTFLDYAWYAQAGYKIADRFTPYARFERVTVRDNDPYFVALGTQDLSKTIAGVRFDIIPTSSLKVEYRFINQPSDNYNEVAVQWAFAF